MNIKVNQEQIKNFTIFLFLVSISAFRLNYYVALPSYLLILCYSFFKDGKIKLSGIFKWSLLFWGYYLVSIIWSRNPSDTLQNFSAFVYIVGIMIFIPKLVNTKEDIDKFILLVFYSIAFTAMYIIILTPFSSLGIERLGPSIGLNENIFGIRMAVGALVSLYIIKSNDTKIFKIKKIIVFTFLIIFIGLTLFSGSKKALLFILLGSFAFIFFGSIGIQKILKLFIIFLIGFLCVFTIFHNERLYSVIGFRIERTYLTLLGDNANNKTLSIIGNKNVGTTDISLLKRQFYIKEAIKLFKEHPILGYGGNGFTTYMRQINYQSITYSHNNYTELLATLGLVGFIIYYFYWFKDLICIFKLYKESKNIEEKRKSLLFLVIIVMLLILDYGCVSYIVEFNLLMLCVCDCYIHYRKEQLE